MANISYILNKPHNENVSLSYVGGLLYPGTTDNSLLMSYYIDWCIKFDDSELLHTTTDFVNYLLRKIDELTERVSNLENNAPAPTVPVTGISISNTPLNMNVGDTYKLTVLIAPANATNTNVTWSSSDTSIATVSNTGSVIAKSEGNVTITATSVSNPSVKDTCTIKVQAVPVSNVSISNTIASLFVGATRQLNVSVYPDNATNKNIIWSSSNNSIATVSNSGLVTGISKGNVTITAASESNPSVKDTTNISISNPSVEQIYVTKIELDVPSTITYGNTAKVIATVYPSLASNKKVVFSSSNTSVATVNESTGAITPLKAGTFTITASATDGSGVTATSSTITVERATQTITASDKTITFGTTGNSLSATTSGNGTISYKVASGSSVSVNSSTGALTINSGGNTTITITAAQTDQYNVATKNVTVIVYKALQTLSVSANTSSIEVGGTTTATVSGNKTPVTWSSSDANIATVNSTTGLVTGKSGGTVTITATAAGNENYNEAKGTVSIKVNKAIQTITASDKTITYGTTGNSLSATTSGNGTISYKVASGSSVSVNSTTGALIINSAGNTTITITASETGQYKQATKDVTVIVNKASQTITASDKTITYGTTGNSLNATASGNGTISYKVASGSSVSVNSSTGELTINSAGNTVITITASANTNYNEATKNVTVIVNKASQTLSVSADPSTIEIDGTTIATVSGNKTPVTWSSSDANIATVNSTTGLVTGKSEGTATITATAAANENYNEGKGTVSIKVNAPAKTYYYYVGQTPITSDNYSTLAETTNTLLTSKVYKTEKFGKIYMLVPNSVSSISAEQPGLGSWSSDSIIIDNSVSIPDHKAYVTAGMRGANAEIVLTFNY